MGRGSILSRRPCLPLNRMPALPGFATLRRHAADRWARWPNRCAVCHTETLGPLGRICDACLARFGAERPRCRSCARAVPASIERCGACLRDAPPWTHAVALADYGYPWDGLLGAFKFRDALDLLPALSARLAERIQAARADQGLDAVLPIPLADARLRERGYDQTALLAHALGRRLRLPCIAALRRVIDTPHQTGLTRDARRANLRGAFVIDPLAMPLAGQRVALVDDVLTTGATLGEAAQMLRAAGVAELRVWVVARTPD